MSREFHDRLTRRLRRAGVALDSQAISRLATYFELLANWNGKINLTGFDLTDPSTEAIDKLFVEPVLASRHVPAGAERMIDIGSGGGSPAIPMMIVQPHLRLLLVEAKVRKSVFLKEALRGLELSGDVATTRYEQLLSRPDLHEAHDLLTIRAVRVEPRVLMSLQAFVKPEGDLFLFRSDSSAPGPITPPLTVSAIHSLLDHSSNLVVLRKRTIGYRRGVSRGT